MKQYTSWGYEVDVELKDGRVYRDVLLCPNPDNKEEHLLERYNGDTVNVKTNILKKIKSHKFGKETLI